jgi:hypothetical protein
MNDYKIEVLDGNEKFIPLRAELSLEDAWYWWKRMWELEITAVITHPDDEPF